MSSAHRFYFQKFLAYHNADRPWNFVLEVEELNKISDHNKRKKKVASTMQAYFRKRGNYFRNAQGIIVLLFLNFGLLVLNHYNYNFLL